MQAIRVKEKVKVFISSNIGEKYACIREALKLLLTETNMCEVYMFEDEGATSTDVVSSYMRKLERSDIVVYLIDNKDGIGEGTLKEKKFINIESQVRFLTIRAETQQWSIMTPLYG